MGDVTDRIRLFKLLVGGCQSFLDGTQEEILLGPGMLFGSILFEGIKQIFSGWLWGRLPRSDKQVDGLKCSLLGRCGHANEVAVKDMGTWENKLHAFLAKSKMPLMKKLGAGEWDEKVESELKEAIEEFKK